MEHQTRLLLISCPHQFHVERLQFSNDDKYLLCSPEYESDPGCFNIASVRWSRCLPTAFDQPKSRVRINYDDDPLEEVVGVGDRIQSDGEDVLWLCERLRF